MAANEGQEGLGRLELTSVDTAAEREAALRDIVPEAFDETGQLDLAKLKESLGELGDGKKDRYNLSWAGKTDAQRALQILSTGTLQPQRKESQDFDATQNAIIEGDNLEVLKLLQKSYHGKVKMIYIDPPYNTGNDFIYPDNFREGLQTYLEYTGQAQKKVRETEENLNRAGRIHSNWLTMMYPRLALARNLLREDGVIFVSIDDHEVHNLRMLMDEVFGEENFVAQIVWRKRVSPDSDEKHITANHDYVVAYARNKLCEPILGFGRSEEQDARYENPDNDPRGDWTSSDLTRREYREHDFYEVTLPSGRKVWPARGRSWGVPPSRFAQLREDNRIWFGPDGDSMPRRKRFLSEVSQRVVPVTFWDSKLSADNQSGSKELLGLFPGVPRILENPKPVQLIKTCMQIGAEPDAIILDFFAGSGTTAQAVMELNAEDGGNRRFILVQLPEPLDPPITLPGPSGDGNGSSVPRNDSSAPGSGSSAPWKDSVIPGNDPSAPGSDPPAHGSGSSAPRSSPSAPGSDPSAPRDAAALQGAARPPQGQVVLRTIADITRERVRRAAAKIAAKRNTPTPALPLSGEGEGALDLGFRAFRLTGSNFKLWEDKSEGDADKLAAQLTLYAENVLPDRDTESILFEILLKSGYELSTTIEPIEVDGEPVYKIAGGRLLAYLADPVDERALRRMIEMDFPALEPGEKRRIVCLDRGFRENDAMKANLAQQARQWNANHPERPVDLSTV